MTQRRWQPPPMAPPEPDAQKSDVHVDEKVVRAMLQVNPAMRQGRTTSQVKKALERGEGLSTSGKSPASTAPATPTPSGGGAGTRELDDTLAFFLRGKAEKLGELEADFAARRATLAQEEKHAREQLREQVAAFVALLDEKALASGGARALAPHADLLARLGFTPARLLEEAKRGRR